MENGLYFPQSKGLEIGKSLVDTEKSILPARCWNSNRQGVNSLLPVDVVVTDDFKNPTTHKTVAADAIPGDMQGWISDRNGDYFHNGEGGENSGLERADGCL